MKRKKPAKQYSEERQTVAKRIAAAATQSTLKALAFANYGGDAESVSKRLTSHEEPAAFRPMNKTGLSQFIQDWLFLGECKTDSSLKKINDPKSLATKRDQLEAEMTIYLSDRLEAGDWKFFHNFADRLKSEVDYRDAVTLKNRSPIHAELLACKLNGDTANLSRIAQNHHVSVRRVRKINQTISAKTLPPGHPRK